MSDYQYNMNKILSCFDGGVDEIVINGFDKVFLYRNGVTEIGPQIFEDSESYINWLFDFTIDQDTRIDPYLPFNGGILDNQSVRWHCVAPPISTEPVLCFRKSRFSEVSLDAFNLLQSQIRLIERGISDNLAFLIYGNTGSGKSTLLCALLKKYFFNKRLIILESLREIPRISPMWIGLQEKCTDIEGKGGIKLSEVFAQTLRLRPDRFVIGEIRGDESTVFLDSYFTGHGGPLATIHADTAMEARERLLSLYKGNASLDWCKKVNLISIGLVRDNPPKVQEVTLN